MKDKLEISLILDPTFRSVNGEQDDFEDISIKDDQIYEENTVENDQTEDEAKNNDEEDQEDFELKKTR